MKATGAVGTQLGVIVAVVMKYWLVVPMSVKVWYDLEDMVNDAVVHLMKARSNYDQAKCSAETFAYIVTRNFCRNRVKSLASPRRCAEMVPYNDLLGTSVDRVTFEPLEREALAELMGAVSDETRLFLAGLLGDRTVARKPCYKGTKRWDRITKELRLWDNRMGGGAKIALLSAAQAR